MKTVDFIEKKAEKNGEVTPKALIEDLLMAIEKGLVEAVVFVVRQPDGEIKHGYSNTKQSEIVGLLEIGKLDVINDMYEER